jgi:hypothetical protein
MRKFNETVELPLSNSNKKQSQSRARVARLGDDVQASGCCPKSNNTMSAHQFRLFAGDAGPWKAGV